MATGSFRVSTERLSASKRTIGSMPRKRTHRSFCGKGPADVRIMAGPNVWICDECVQLCCDAFWPDEVFRGRRPQA